VSLLTKAPVQPLHLYRLEVSIREQARSHQTVADLRLRVIQRTCGSELAHEEAGTFSQFRWGQKLNLASKLAPASTSLAATFAVFPLYELNPAPAEDTDDFIQMPRHRLSRRFCIAVLQGVEDQAVFVFGAERHVVGGVVRL
jgi:hypothetical protein